MYQDTTNNLIAQAISVQTGQPFDPNEVQNIYQDTTNNLLALLISKMQNGGGGGTGSVESGVYTPLIIQNPYAQLFLRDATFIKTNNICIVDGSLDFYYDGSGSFPIYYQLVLSLPPIANLLNVSKFSGYVIGANGYDFFYSLNNNTDFTDFNFSIDSIMTESPNTINRINYHFAFEYE